MYIWWDDLSLYHDPLIDAWNLPCTPAPSPVVLHYHDYYELNYILSGTGTAYFGDKEYRVAPGQVYVINDREPHYTYCDPDVELRMIVVVFRPGMIADGVFENREFIMPFRERSMQYRNLIVASDPCAAEIGALMRLIWDERKTQRAGFKLFMQAYVYEILANLYRYYREADQLGKDPQLQRDIENIAPALSHMKENFASELTLADMAAKACMSPNHFSSVFKKVTGMGFRAYLTQLKLAAAKELLLKGELTVSGVALRVGFPSAAYFARVFAREVGMPPSEYRQKTKKNSEDAEK